MMATFEFSELNIVNLAIFMIILVNPLIHNIEKRPN